MSDYATGFSRCLGVAAPVEEDSQAMPASAAAPVLAFVHG